MVGAVAAIGICRLPSDRSTLCYSAPSTDLRARGLVVVTELVLPSYHGREGCPKLMREALVAGKLVVASRWRSIAKIIDSVCPILLEPVDGAGLATAMEELLYDRAFYRAPRERVHGKLLQGVGWPG